MLHVLLQAAQATPAPPPHVEPWVYLAALAMGPVSLVLLALIRRGSNAKVTTAERIAKEALALAQGHTAKFAEVDDQFTEHTERINDLDERMSATDPHIKTRDDRLDRIERSMTAESTAREERRKEQATQELRLVETLTRIETNLTNVTKQVENNGNNAGRRR